MPDTKYILGLNHGEINSSAALAKGGRVIAGCLEERFNRENKTRRFPRQSVDFCLKHAGIELSDCTAIAQAWNPGAGWHKFNPLISGQRARREDYFYSVPDNLFQINDRPDSDWVRMDFGGNETLPPVYYIKHHRTHAANAFFLSPFEEAAILTCDWRGEYECTTWGVGRDTDIEILQVQQVPSSLGMYYGTFTELLGYRADNDEWKVMALSAYDVDSADYEDAIRSTLTFNDDGTLELDQSFYTGALVDQPKLYSPKFAALFGGREGQSGEEAGEWHHKVASAMQVVAEEVAVHFLNHLHKLTNCDAVTLSGGFFMNSVFNGKLLSKTPFKKMFIPYAPGDNGNSIGAALYVSHCLMGSPRELGYSPSEIGPEYSDDEIEEALRRRNISFNKVVNAPVAVAELLSAGEIVAVFNGQIEFGERALGNRSILADPRPLDVKDRINATVKYRESYRPFAPATLFEKAPDFFEVAPGYESPYMETVVPVKEACQQDLAAITHVDGSGRIQTVKSDSNPFFYSVISEFEKRTGYPVVLNTSFNINGEPIVLTPDDALSTFYNSGLKHLMLGSYLVQKT